MNQNHQVVLHARSLAGRFQLLKVAMRAVLFPRAAVLVWAGNACFAVRSGRIVDVARIFGMGLNHLWVGRTSIDVLEYFINERVPVSGASPSAVVRVASAHRPALDSGFPYPHER